MELWIRSQDKNKMIQVQTLKINNEGHDNLFSIYDKNTLGVYKGRKRALEVLDEIAATIKNRYIVKPNTLLKQDDLAKEQKRLDYLYSGEFIIEKPPFEIDPINSNIIYYEMPEE